jgi:hypothetical protein
VGQFLRGFALFLVRARQSLGRWPAPYQPDPKDLGFDFHYTLLLVGIPVMMAAVLTTIVLTLALRRGDARRWRVPLAAVASLAVVILLARLDPGSLFTWLGD